jgi:hypothetical protein
MPNVEALFEDLSRSTSIVPVLEWSRRYLTDSAVLLNTAGDPIEALSYIEAFEKREQSTDGKEERPRFAWIDSITAESSLKLHQYEQATF